MTKIELNCPLPLGQSERVLLAHGGGGRLMQQLLQQSIFPAFNLPRTGSHDGVVLPNSGPRLAFTTDSYVVQPLFFPGGDIGQLAVYGTVNDLAMCGARPQYLSVGLILEEGLEMTVLQRVLQSMQTAAVASQVHLVTGDTKVVERGKGDGIYINTAGIGVVETDLPIGPAAIQAGDVVLLNGDIGRHGMAVMAERNKLDFAPPLLSDCAPLGDFVLQLLQAGIEIHCMRDPTRGGVATALNELLRPELAIEIQGEAVPVRVEVANACEILGFDPLYVANEGKVLIFVPAAQAEQTLQLMRNHPLGTDSAIVGQVQQGQGLVHVRNAYGTSRILDLLSGEQLPRIC